MTKDSRGTKRHCQACGKTFYDLNRSPITCALCGELFDPEVLLKSRKVKPVPAEAAAAPAKPAEGEVVEPAIEATVDEVPEDDLDDDGEVIKVNTDDDETDEESLLASGDALGPVGAEGQEGLEDGDDNDDSAAGGGDAEEADPEDPEDPEKE